jgi:hypothetical protein
MKMSNFFGKAALLAATGLAASVMVPASASAATFVLTSGSNNDGSIGNVRTFIGSDNTKVEVTAYSLNGTTLAQAAVGAYTPGLGILNGPGDDSHTIDNSGYVDIMVFQFDKTVTVDKVGITEFGDTDLNYAVGSTNVLFTNSLVFANLAAFNAAFGSTILSNGNGTSGDRDINNSPALSGNLFYVAAAFSNSNSNDSFKINGITYTTPAVPEPATWAMMIGGLAVVGSAMRRRKTAVSFA